MSNTGYIKLHRQIEDCWIWNCEPFSKGQAWIDLLLQANHEDHNTMFNGDVMVIGRGQRLTSIKALSERWMWSRHKVSDFLDTLEKDNMISQKRDNKRTLINIVNYGIYQDAVSESGHQTDIKRTSNGHQKDTNNNDKNDKNGRIESNTIVLDRPKTPSDIEQIVEAWNSLPACIAKVTRIVPDKARYVFIKARLKEYSLGDFEKAIENIRTSDFLQGKNKNGWTITFDWFIRPNNFPKVLDGQYNKQQSEFQSQEDFLKSIIEGGE